ncbi:mucin-5AC-like [Bombyx mandarina]|uniref:Mucin-5AC-like n=1 Tax=Bombyx mandarina TaxID=7092 RepID=A0A6J2JAK5_BOMMA|nr:mucin-5AC-like [Bombyx mandarina]
MWLQAKLIGFLFNFLLLIINTRSFYISPGSHEFLVTEIVRVKRQAGYVYNKPSIQFDLPSTSTVSTQEPNVDRTQAQQMYYVYPAPPKEQSSNAEIVGDTTTKGNNGGSAGGYSYGSRNTIGSQQDAGDTSSQAISLGTGQLTNTNAGYGYNVPTDVGSPPQTNTGSRATSTGSTATSSVSTSYFYDTPSSISNIATAKSQITSDSSQTSKSAAGYNYDSVGITNNNQKSNDLVNQNTNAERSQSTSPSGYNYNNAGLIANNFGQIETETISVKGGLTDLSSSYNYQAPSSESLINTEKNLLNSEAGSKAAGYGSGPAPVTSTSINSIASLSALSEGNSQKQSGNSGYNYNTPTTSNTVESVKKITIPNSRATSSVSANYNYEGPAPSQLINTESLRYLPPSSGAGSGASAPAINSGTNRSNGINNQYVPPTSSFSTSVPGMTPLASYIPQSSGISSSSSSQAYLPPSNSISTNQPSQLYVPSIRSNTPLSSSMVSNSQTYIPPSTSQYGISSPGPQLSTQTSVALSLNSYIPPQNTGQLSAPSIQPSVPSQSYLQPSSRNLSSGTSQPNGNYLPPTSGTLTPTSVNSNYLSPVTDSSLPAVSYLPPKI